jgi:hypothetical protein
MHRRNPDAAGRGASEAVTFPEVMGDDAQRFRIVVRRPRESEWWDQASSNLQTDPDEVPEVMRPLIRTSVHQTALISQREVMTIREWAESLPGWDEESGLQVLEHPIQRRIDWRDL